MRDRAEIKVRSGRGGDGCVSFRREKYIPRGGPDGGDGGRGGHVFIRCKEKLPSLEHIRNRSLYKAGAGHQGAGGRKNGRHGDDVFIDAPPGTTIYDSDTGTLIGEIIEPGDKIIVAAGGAGGRGNCHFATPENRTPREFDPGEPGEERRLSLVFSIPADAALIGFPGSGKSALLARLTRSRTKIGEYPFTTMSPHLGVLTVNPYTSVKILDLPALVAGAAEGKGVGNYFLVHLRRARAVVYVLDPFEDEGASLTEQLQTLRKEVMKYDRAYVEKNEIVVVNKIDLADESVDGEIAKIMDSCENAIIYSAETGEGEGELIETFERLAAPEESQG